MNSTPAPVSTASAAASIWSGVGEVKTWPGQAASSMPMADEAGMQRLMAGAAAGDQRDLAGLERLAPDEFALLAERDDIGMRGGETVEAFREHRVDGVDELLHFSPPRLAHRSERSVTDRYRRLSEPAHELGEHARRARDSLARITEVRQLDHTRRMRLARWSTICEPSGVGPPIGQQESVALGRREMADLEDRLEMRAGIGVG